MVLKLFSWHKWHSLTGKRARVQNSRNRRGSHHIFKWKHNNLAPSLACTRSERSMVSIGMLAEDGYRTTLNESTWAINQGNLKIGSGHKYNNLYPLKAINLEGSVSVAEKTDPNLWHGRLGHMSQAWLDRLMSVGYIPKLTAKDFCEHYQYGKWTWCSHSLHYETVRRPLELVHIDICGSMSERSLGSPRYCWESQMATTGSRTYIRAQEK